MKKNKCKIFLITGGTGGHIFPAISFADYLKSKDIEYLIITDSRGLNFFNKNEYNYKKIFSSHLNKKNIRFIKAFFSLFIGLIQFNLLFLIKRPKNIITFGSYVSFAPLLSATLLKKIFNIKIYFHEQNSIMGKVHKLFLFSSDKVFLTYEKTLGLNEKCNTIFSGFPIRKEVLKYQKNTIKKKEKYFNLLVFGGSQGSLNLSKIIIKILSQSSNSFQKYINLTIQVPKDYLELFKSELEKTNINYEINSFYSNIIKRLAETDLCICRAGSSTINELLNLKVPSILVPLPSAKNNHQYHNAKYLEDLGAAILIEEKNLNNNENKEILKKLVYDRNILENMILNLKKIKQLDSNNLIYKEIFNI